MSELVSLVKKGILILFCVVAGMWMIVAMATQTDDNKINMTYKCMETHQHTTRECWIMNGRPHGVKEPTE